MREKPVELNPELEALLLQKSYEDLDTQEKSFVQTQISASDYTAFRLVLVKSKAVFTADQSKPNAAVKKQLSAAMLERSRNQKPVETFLTSFATYRIPAWQAMLGAAAMLLCFTFFAKPEVIQLEPEEVIVYKRDTVYEKGATVLVRDTVYEKFKPDSYRGKKKRTIPTPKASILVDEDTLSVKAINASPKDIFATKPPAQRNEELSDPDSLVQVSNAVALPKGRSIEQDGKLMDLLEKVY